MKLAPVGAQALSHKGANEFADFANEIASDIEDLTIGRDDIVAVKPIVASI